MKNRAHSFALSVCFLLSSSLLASNASADRTAVDEAIERGNKLYVQACAACHGKDLEGATGFNLKDGEWVHGSTRADIQNNIKNGFLSKGMPAFGAMYDDAQISDIAQFVLSKREGFEDVTYRLYQMGNAEERNISNGELIKEGELANNLLDFELPEVEQYAIEFKGTLHVPDENEVMVFADGSKRLSLSMFIDGNEVERVADRWQPHWPITRGTHNVTFRYYSAELSSHHHNVALFVRDAGNNIKKYPLSTLGKQIHDKIQLPIKVEGSTRILRKRILNLPSNSVFMGFPNHVNLAFNTKSCAFVGAWTGDFLNVGPNVIGRGKSPAIPLGDWVYHFPEVMQVNGGDCRFKNLTPSDQPKFEYLLGKMNVNVQVSAPASKKLVFDYRIKKAKKDVVLVFPASVDMGSVTSSAGRVDGNKITIPKKLVKHFTVTVSL